MWSVHSFLLSREKIVSGGGVEADLKEAAWEGMGVEGWQVFLVVLRKKELSNKFGPSFVEVSSILTSSNF